MTPAERLAARALWGATFLPGSFDKRFARDLAERAEQADAAPLTERQAACLWRLCHRYRRQLFRRTGSAPGLTVAQVRDHFEARARREGRTMDAVTWETTTDVQAMLRVFTGTPEFSLSDRKLRLFACGLVRLCWERLTDDAPCPYCCLGSVPTDRDDDSCHKCDGHGRVNRSRRAVEVAEKFAEGEATEGERDAAYHAAWLVVSAAADTMQTSALLVARQAAWCAAVTAQAAVDGIREYPATQGGVSPAAAAQLLRCVAGNPWRPASFGWRTVGAEQVWYGDWMPTRDVLALARGCYAERRADGLLDGGRLAVLADALEEAGVSEEVCSQCDGGWLPKRGAPDQGMLSRCPDCKGHGRVTHPILEHLRTQETVCGLCGGDGRPNSGDDWERRNGDCPACAGAGRWPAVHAVGCWAIDCILGRS